MRFHCAIVSFAILLFCIGFASAQLVSVQEVDGKAITCMRSGLHSDLNDCGVRPWDTYVFVGTISVITSLKDDEKQLQIVPDEIFFGAPPNPLVAETSQAACLPKLAVGERWLFFLQTKDDGKPILIDFYGGDSVPVARAQAQLETLRRLKTIGDFALLRGQVRQGPSWDGKGISGARVIAHREAGNLQFSATTGAEGRYEFPPLPPGSYKLTVDPVGPFRADDSEMELKRGECYDLALSRSPHAQMGGHVRHPDGSPVDHVHVILIWQDETGYTTTESDENGHFLFDSMRGGKYVVGIKLPGTPPWKDSTAAGAGVDIPKASLYYPGLRKRSDAPAIELETDEKRDDIDFVIP